VRATGPGPPEESVYRIQPGAQFRLVTVDSRSAGHENGRMKVATGRVVGGKIVLEGEPLAEGAVVTVVAQDDGDTFEVTPEEERALLDAIAQADRGQVVSWETVREHLRRNP
jgi:hypothetical protein